MSGGLRGGMHGGSGFDTLEEVVQDDLFPELDLALRRGRHVGRDDGAVYAFLVDAADHLEPFYRRYGCELVQQSDGYFYLLPSGDRLGRRHLSAGEMLVGQTLALLYLDPMALQHGGVIERELLLQRLAGLLGTEALYRTLHPRRRRAKIDERVAGERIRAQVAEALRKLADLGFVDLVDEGSLRLRPALLRFAEPIRGLEDPALALEQLVARGEVILGEAAEVDTEASDADTGDADDAADDEELSS